MKIWPLASGSSGNVTFIEEGSTRLLIDCGCSATYIESVLSEIQVDPRSLQAILITHGHYDHISGAGVLSRRFNLPIFATFGTWMDMAGYKKLGYINPENKRYLTSGPDLFSQPLTFDNLEITTFAIPHDAQEPIGFRVDNGSSTAVFATDLGHLNSRLKQAILGAKFVLLESNYDRNMLYEGRYPLYLIKRIDGDLGHLSNDWAARFAFELVKTGTQHIVLAHLSKENNRPQLALETVTRFLEDQGVQPDRDLQLQVACRSCPSGMVYC